jgi:hypothetical protein
MRWLPSGWRWHWYALGHKVTRHEALDQSNFYGLRRDRVGVKVTHYSCSCGRIWA